MNPIFNKSSNLYFAFSIRARVGLLLLLYTSVFLFSPGVVHHTEHDHVSHEEDTCKNDPCHVSVYHPGAEGSCNHKFHFTKDHEKCPWCDITLARQLITSAEIFYSWEFSFLTIEQYTLVFPPFKIAISQPGRGPPFMLAA